jgi:hypothetical protein
MTGDQPFSKLTSVDSCSATPPESFARQAERITHRGSEQQSCEAVHARDDARVVPRPIYRNWSDAMNRNVVESRTTPIGKPIWQAVTTDALERATW